MQTEIVALLAAFVDPRPRFSSSLENKPSSQAHPVGPDEMRAWCHGFDEDLEDALPAAHFWRFCGCTPTALRHFATAECIAQLRKIMTARRRHLV